MTGPGIRIGQRVRVPWGRRAVEGTIVEIFGPAHQRYVRLDLELDESGGRDEDRPRITLPADSLETVDAASPL